MYSTGKKVQSQTNSQVLLCTEDILPLHCVGVLSKLNGTISVNLKILNVLALNKDKSINIMQSCYCTHSGVQ